MNLNNKKIVAREFVLLMITIVLSCMTLGIMLLYNGFIQNRRERLRVEVALNETQADSLSRNYSNKNTAQHNFTRKMNELYFFVNVPHSQQWKKLSNLAKEDSIEYKWKNVWDKSLKDAIIEAGYEDPSRFKKFILSNIINFNDIKNAGESDLVKKTTVLLYEKDKLLVSKLTTSSDRISVMYIVTLVLFGALFVLRYLYYSLKWSINILKQ